MQSSRRTWLMQSGALSAAALATRSIWASAAKFELKYVLASSLYGTLPIDDVLAEVRKCGAEQIDLWPRVHADHREQVEQLGVDAFRGLLEKHHVKLGMTTRYDLGPFGLAEEMKFVKQLGGSLIVTGAERAKEGTTKEAAITFAQRLEPVAAAAEEEQITIAIENHSGMLLNSPDAIRWFADSVKSPRLGIALAPAHLPQDPELLANLVGDLGEKLVHFYAWQKGDGFLSKLPKEQELKQLPGKGSLDFAPVLAALKRSHYDGWVEIFMHPTPRGIPILETAEKVSAAVNEARNHLEHRLQQR